MWIFDFTGLGVVISPWGLLVFGWLQRAVFKGLKVFCPWFGCALSHWYDGKILCHCLNQSVLDTCIKHLLQVLSGSLHFLHQLRLARLFPLNWFYNTQMKTTLVLKTTFVSCFVDNPQHFCGPSEAACTLGIFWWFSLSSQAAVQFFLGPEKLVRQKKKLLRLYNRNDCHSAYIAKGMANTKKKVQIWGSLRQLI